MNFPSSCLSPRAVFVFTWPLSSHAVFHRGRMLASSLLLAAGAMAQPVSAQSPTAAVPSKPLTLARADVAQARTAALLRQPSKNFEDYINSGRPSFLSTPGTTPLEGGVPIIVNGQTVGAVGVSGAHGPNDSQVAQAGADAVR
ncbi:MAG: heme-binding protein [Burkholderiaceae bacterium]